MKRSVAVGNRRIEYTLIQVSGRESVLLQALAGDAVRVYAPRRARLKEIDRFVMERADWIFAARARLIQDAPVRAPLNDGAETLFEGETRRLSVRKGLANRIALTDGRIEICAVDLSDGALREQLKRWMCREALKRIRARLDEYAPGIGVPYGRVTIREQRTRWGSCSSRRNLNFNWKLIRAPREVLTYVVIHELCHLKNFNHSARFWDDVKARQPDFEVWKKWLKTHGKELDL